MNDPNYRLPDAHGNGDQVPAPAPAHSFWWKTWQVLKVVQARLRFFAILAVIGTVIGFWDTLAGYYDKWTRPLYGQEETASPDTEWFCPMHPFIVRDNHKEKCPICHMDLAKRKKGAGKPEPLAPGTVSRVQLSPYRVALAGVRTSPVEYRPLVKVVTTFGTVEFNEKTERHVAARQKGRVVKLYANYTGQMVAKGEKLAVLDVRYSKELMVYLDDLRRARRDRDRATEDMARQALRVYDVNDAHIEEFLRTGKAELTITAPIRGHIIKKYQREGNFVEDGTPLYDVDDLDTVWVLGQVYEADQSLLREGMQVRATTLGLPGKVFKGKLDFIYPHLDEATRTLAVRFHIRNRGHQLRPGGYATVTVDLPPNKVRAIAEAAVADAPLLTAADTVAHALGMPGGPSAGAGVLSLLHTAGRQALLERGLVAVVPDSAVIDTGKLKVVYREASPGVYEGVTVRLGPRMAEPGGSIAYYPVLHGLEAGERVVTNGSFLIDAETRLNPAAGSIYFGGSGGQSGSSAMTMRPSTPESEDAQEMKVRVELARLGAEDRRLAEAQKFCPVLQTNRIGSMGAPFKVLIEGRVVFLCCGSCEDKARANPRKTLDTIEQFKQGKTAPPRPTTPSADPSAEADIQAELAKLAPADRKLAEAQRFCVVEGENRLGSMPKPVKIMVKGQPVFLCCKNCLKKALADPDKTLDRLKRLKDRRQP